MFARFTCLSNDVRGLYNAIYATATANAGFTPVLPAGCSQYTVINNAEAGGWTLDARTNLPASATYATGQYMTLTAPVPKTSTSDYGTYKKALQLVTTSATNNAGDAIMFQGVVLYQNNFVQFMPTSPANTGSQGVQSFDYFPSGIYTPDVGVWYISCTSQYIVLAHVDVTTALDNEGGKFLVFSDLSQGAAYDYDPGNPHFPAAFVAGSNCRNTTYNASGYADKYQYRLFRNGSVTQSLGPLVGPNTYWGPLNENNDTDIIHNSPYYGDNTAEWTSYNMQPDKHNNLRPTLADFAFWHPLKNQPMRKLYGIRHVGLRSYPQWNDSYLQASPYGNQIVYDDDGIPWFIVRTGWNSNFKAIRAR